MAQDGFAVGVGDLRVQSFPLGAIHLAGQPDVLEFVVAPERAAR